VKDAKAPGATRLARRRRCGPLPLDLSSFGLTNCWLRVNPDLTDWLSGSSGSAIFTLGVPLNTAMVGLLAHQQAVVLDAAAHNPVLFVLSDAAVAVVGS